MITVERRKTRKRATGPDKARNRSQTSLTTHSYDCQLVCCCVTCSPWPIRWSVKLHVLQLLCIVNSEWCANLLKSKHNEQCPALWPFLPRLTVIYGGKKVHVLRFPLAQISTGRNIILLPVVCAGKGVESGFRELCSNSSGKVHHRSVEC
jgi:hypothetical protein